MKKSIKITSIILVTVIILVIGFFVLNYLATGRIGFSAYCGDEFSNQFKQAVETNDFNFCLNYNGKINYYRFAIDEGYYYCDTIKGGNSPEIMILGSGLPQPCLEAMAHITYDVGACKLMNDNVYKDTCISDIIKKTGNNQYCSLILPQDYESTGFGKLICIGNYHYVSSENQSQNPAV